SNDMKFKNSDFFNFVHCFNILGLLLFMFFCSESVRAQDFPYGLERGNGLASPRSIDEYKQLVTEYKNSICFPSQSNCNVDETKA
ncbi:hypothetical protein, partial [Escherichia coli]|uniref:hypothetical protein n=1 Tax=Escherichia coli TaxID=562 RepID=UPI001A7E1AC2